MTTPTTKLSGLEARPKELQPLPLGAPASLHRERAERLLARAVASPFFDGVEERFCLQAAHIHTLIAQLPEPEALP